MLPRFFRTHASACLLAAAVAAFFAPKSRATYAIDSLTGDVTQNEVDSFIATMQTVTIPTSQWSYNGNTTLHNYLADGVGGCELRAMNLMYPICQANPNFANEQMQLINLAIQWNEAWLTHRNDLPLGEGRVMWTGKVDKLWPPNAPTSTDPTYAASEVGDTVGNLAETALNILNTPSIWNQTVPDGNPNGYGATYLQRAQTYTQMLEDTMDEYFNTYFLNSSTAYIQAPTSSAWTSLNENVNAWNRGFMFNHAYQVLSQIHAVLNDNATKASLYKQVALNWANLFAQNAQSSTAADGAADYNWGYGNYGDIQNRLTGESTSHGGFDMMGFTRAYRTPGFTTTVTNQAMELYAATLIHEIRESAQLYAMYIDRSSSNQTSTGMPQEWFYLVPYNPSMFVTLATDAVNSNQINGSRGSLYTALILWNKHAIYTTANIGVNDTDAGISYAGTWSYSGNRNLGDYQNDVHYTRTTGNSFSYTFSGTGIDYVTETNSDEGNVAIYIDGVQQTTVSCYSASRQPQVTVYSANGLISGTHTVKAVMSSGSYLLLDALVVHQPTSTGVYTITASAGAGGSISPSGSVSVAQGANQTFAIAASSGYSISDVTVDGASVGAVNSYTFGNVQANHTIAASFAAIASYTITASAGTGGSITPSGTVAVSQGGSQTFSIAASSGYSISGVTVDGAGVGAVSSYTFSNVQANHTIAASFAVSSGALPAGWTDVDIGAPAIAGSASYASGTFTVNGCGADIWGTSDQFNYAYQSSTGDGSVTAQVASQQNTATWAKSGVMYRGSTAANDMFVDVSVTPSNGIAMQYRTAVGGTCTSITGTAGVVAPYWVRIVRSGTTFTGYSSADGATWSQVGSVTIAMASSATVGLEVCSHNTSSLNTSTFQSVTIAASSNLAPAGTAYGWFGLSSSTATTNQTAQPGLNDGNLTNNVDLDSAGDSIGAWEAAGVKWSSAKTISSADFINGDITTGGDGFLTANLQLQFTTDGTTWANSGWTVSPAYPYSSSAGGQKYTYSGPAVSGVLGARFVGQVRTVDTSYHWIVKEVQFTGN